MIKKLRILFNEIYSAFTENISEFPELFPDYEKYHENVETGNLIRAKLIENWISPDSSVLDVGVGDGIISDYLIKKRKSKITGLDISLLACEKAQRHGIKTEIRDINYSLGLKKNELFDYVLLSEVIEHILYPQKILLEAVQHAKKGVIVTIPNSAYIRWRIHLLRGYNPRQSFMHLHFWSIKDFKIFCNMLGVQILDSKTASKSSILKFKNLLAWQQCWLLAPNIKE